ncbi:MULTISPECIES: hypothetical protein [Mesorhizobium]|uniref:Uncharacterized protein n=2 Tax=Mesorhizobium TaxID=68287 RepID=A0A1A5I144_RHILI|nr:MULTISPECIES: hypothetical protein [Mesorhizobium]ETA72985.1 hypothetical protein MesloDRAFT_1883 [Mesorhizobium japonicum R7A]MBE1709956.1 hypothetical protein [Mesorhizobium japonicum]MBE1716600.1 hypothetical protein [Mesorhizobium japonicum]MUT24414.1 hypothetical protein [Mesorhizobium japonicum]MUT29073.1 hypothetical protein [Mesorhizobium japonicum]
MKRTFTAIAILFAAISAADARRTVPPTVMDDPLGHSISPTVTPGASDLIDNTPTSTIHEVHAPNGMSPLTVPSDPTGTSLEPTLPVSPPAPATALPLTPAN